MNPPLVIAGVTVAGGLVGLGTGWLAVRLERFEKLEDEERQERLDYERDIAVELSRAASAGEEPLAAQPWAGERYGWTWLERWLSPALGAIGFGAFGAHEAFGSGLLIHLLWIAIFVQVVDFDLKHRLILNVVTYPSVLAAVVLSEWSPGLTVTSAIIGAVGVAAFFLVQNLVSRGSIGLGDAKLGGLVGAVTGAGPTATHLGAVYAVIAGVFIGGATALVLLVTRVRKLKDPIPYGPFLCAGAALILYLGP
ncbi:MAG TPA: A24 family peptidase [Candidatus Saccharimonadales bacterium]|nr:A24 family peptidase [Candidatus Saccharimonadales bacterium]